MLDLSVPFSQHQEHGMERSDTYLFGVGRLHWKGLSHGQAKDYNGFLLHTF